MNERIKFLVKESNLDVYGLGRERVKWEYTVERYTQSIVNNCIQELKISRKCDPYTGDVYDCEYNKCIDDQINVLKEHFGVEE